MTTTTSKASKAKAEDKAEDTESTPKRVTVSAPAQFDNVMQAITEAGDEGITLKALSEATGLPYRVVHNVTWRLEGSPEVRPNNKAGRKLGEPAKPDEAKIQRVGKGRTVLYAAK